MFRNRRNPALSTSRTYGKDRSGFGSSQLGIAGARHTDAILRMCRKREERQRRIASSLSPEESFSTDESLRQQAGMKDIFDFTSGDSFDNLQKSASL
jgi:hypothetical protein